MDIHKKTLRQKFRKQKIEIAESFKASSILAPRFPAEIVNEPDFVKNELYTLVDYTENYIFNDSKVFKNLYLAERLKMSYSPGIDSDERNLIIMEMIETDKKSIIKTINANVEETKIINIYFEELISPFKNKIQKKLKVLFIGDCLYLDLIGFLIPELLNHGVNLIPEYLTDKNLTSCRKKIKRFDPEEFDLIFFSPFTYEFNQETSPIVNGKLGFKYKDAKEELFNKLFINLEDFVATLTSYFSASLIFHNSISISRHESKIKGFIKNLITYNTRADLRNRINGIIDLIVDRQKNNPESIVLKFDECKYLKNKNIYEELKLGQYFYKSTIQHPAYLGVLFANDYVDICLSKSLLINKKMVVCDLDNTLWDGLIGEGSVKHYHDRQKILKELKNKGVILSIVSKNDPNNVKWIDSTLTESDFVYKYISWNAKVKAFPILENSLNLKKKDFIFVDDRADERDIISTNYPEVLTLDATDDKTWKLFNYWALLLPPAPDGDRTKMYHEKFERDKFLNHVETEDVNNDDLFKNLGLSVNIKLADKDQITRAQELINRTNQFNINSIRISKEKIKNYYDSDRFFIFIVTMADKFGDMGMVSVLIAQECEDEIKLENFVLSCRVFGYGAEDCLMNELKKLSNEKNKPLVGEIIKNEYNSPCHDVFSDHYFDLDDDKWFWNVNGKVKANPNWFN